MSSRALLGIGAVVLATISVPFVLLFFITQTTTAKPERCQPPAPIGSTLQPAAGALTGPQVARVAFSAGFRGEDLVIAVAVSKAESGWDPNAQHLNTNGTTDYGLWQINSVHGELLAGANWRDPFDNATMARILQESGGWDTWTGTYAKGLHLPYMDEARAAAATIPGAGAEAPPLGPSRPAAPVLTQGPTIVLDPGHSGSDVLHNDPATGIADHDYPNHPELEEVWQVAQDVKSELEDDGYRVLLTKAAVDDTVSLRDRAEVANRAGAALAVSIHDDHAQVWENFAQVYEQRVGGYRERPDGTHVQFDNAAVAAASQRAGQLIARARTNAEGRPVEEATVHFDGRQGLAAGDLPLVQLFATVPWVYNEVGAPLQGLSEEHLAAYAAGLARGIKRAVPIRGPPASAGDNCASNTTFAVGDGSPLAIAQSISALQLPYVWGGGHLRANEPSGGGYDCSGTTVAFLARLGHGFEPGGGTATSGQLMSWGVPGPGQVYTVMANTEHVWIQFSDGSRLDTSPWGSGPSGPRYRTGPRTDQYRFVQRHWPNF
jgi:N-acetylmuramoyl-L-alanine amidase